MHLQMVVLLQSLWEGGIYLLGSLPLGAWFLRTWWHDRTAATLLFQLTDHFKTIEEGIVLTAV